MKTARDFVHDAMDGQCGPNWVATSGHHDHVCDRLTTAIEARDAELTSTLHDMFGASQAELTRALDENRATLTKALAALTVARERLEDITKATSHHYAVDIAFKALAALTEVTRGRK